MSEYTKGYTPTDWQDGDVITEEKIDHIEEGVADAHAWLADIEGADFVTAAEVQAMIEAALESEGSVE